MSRIKEPPKSPPTLSVWRAAQVVLAEPALTEAFAEAQQAEKAQKADKTASSTTTGKTGKTGKTDETFGDAYEKALHAQRYALSAAVPLVDALAKVAGDDGVISGDEWKKFGPRFSSLALQIAEKSKTVKPATGNAAAVLVQRTAPATREALRKTTENIVGLDRMPVLQALVDEAAKTKPLAGHRLFAVQHLFASTHGLFEGLLQAGIQAEGSVVFGKNYSTNQEVKSALSARGFTVHDDYAGMEALVDDGKIVGIDAPLLSGLREALKSAAAAKPPQKVLLLDEGGKLNKMLHDVLPQYAHLCTIVEQTTNGLQNMAGTTLKAPAVSVASSQLKREVEGPIIGEDVAAATLDLLEELDPRLLKDKTVGVVGYGAVGIATAKAFAERGYHVVVTDIRDEAVASLKQGPLTTAAGGSIRLAARDDVLGAGIVVGCTGTGAMSLAETAKLKDGAILVSAASGDHEFPQVQTKAARSVGAGKPALPMSQWGLLIDKAAAEMNQKTGVNPTPRPLIVTPKVTLAGDAREDAGIVAAEPVGVPGTSLITQSFPLGDGTTKTLPLEGTRLGQFILQQDERRFMILRGGTPINLGRDLPPEAIQLTRSMLFAACVQAVSEKGTGWKTFSTDTQARIEQHWRSLQ
jgi:S-adenosylhomocysteine hydrolase